ncbi:selenium-dependent molybdenum cofactor biosynthesis protein YqeB [Amedibacterium intestinale]|uniref:selenium-dependent molybdenum cofactor biosynthesis protein YqeB n=1 Tax=Amedibacterium intestinale TaxID=2583452 RepID=UPI000E520A47|nr:selenium-dependent molybdenum cofactor biosynthesis protein YqeB [Amedibacterium intestinale]RHO32712.1 EF2563 family selenium-dependent molybdenum hydroxylase system protein [Erysipelotrichaceae bacterium AM17-60]
MRVIVRGGGDLASGTAYKLFQCGFEVILLECEKPTSIRRYVSFSEAVYHGQASVENVWCVKAESIQEVEKILSDKKIALLVDPDGKSISKLHPDVVVDAILAKKNLGTRIDMAKIVIGLGPGFEAGKDVHAVVETKRGHSLGVVYYEGKAIANTGIPGVIGGYGKERVIHAPETGILHCKAKIGDIVEKGQCIAMIGNVCVEASLSGVLRGILPDGFSVWKGLKMADIDPRKEQVENCTTISDKARCIAGGVVEAILHLHNL